MLSWRFYQAARFGWELTWSQMNGVKIPVALYQIRNRGSSSTSKKGMVRLHVLHPNLMPPGGPPAALIQDMASNCQESKCRSRHVALPPQSSGQKAEVMRKATKTNRQQIWHYGNGKSPMFNRKQIFKLYNWHRFHCCVRIPECASKMQVKNAIECVQLPSSLQHGPFEPSNWSGPRIPPSTRCRSMRIFQDQAAQNLSTCFSFSWDIEQPLNS